ncbi:MAG: AzlC family ABC transporter permease [Anaerolineales bacterium]|nr:AzlC family ABC transporter permease [Anaerolineales bacterium]
MTTTPRAEFWAGVRAELPILVGGIPFGIIYGVLALAAGLPPLLAQAMSAIVFAGSAQFIGVQLMATGTPLAILWLTTFVVNIRHMLYSASVAPYTRHLSRPWRWLLAYLLTDEAFVVGILHYEKREEWDADLPDIPDLQHGANRQPVSPKHYYLLGAGLALWLGWQLSTAVGIFLGTQIPDSWGLDFTLALTFIGMAVPLLKNRPTVAAAITAGIVAVAAHQLPYQLSLIAATLAGIAVGVWLDNRTATPLPTPYVAQEESNP